VPGGQKKYLGLSHLRQLFTVRLHCPWLNILFIISVFIIHNSLLVVAKLLFLHLQTCLQKITLQI